MSSYKDRFVKIGVVFHALYFENEVGDPPPPLPFFAFLTWVAHYLTVAKKSVLWKIFARTSLIENNLHKKAPIFLLTQ